MINIACIGTGYWGKNLVRNFHQLDDANLTYCCDLSEKNLQAMQQEYSYAKFTTDFNEILSNDNVNAVVIATSAVTHYDLAQKALLAGKHVFVEKPMTLVAEDAEKLVDLAAKQQKILMVGHLLEYHPAVLKLKEIIDSGELGDILYIYSQRLNLGKVRQDENVMWSFAPHDISIILFLLALQPEEVAVFGGSYLQNGIHDFAYINLSFASGQKANIHISWLDPNKVRRTMVIGSKKMAIFDDGLPTGKLKIFDKSAVIENGIPRLIDNGYTEPELSDIEPLKAECQHFLDCIMNGTIPRSDGNDGLRVIKVLEAGQKSLLGNGESVKLS